MMKTLQFANGDLMPMLGLGTWKSSPGDVYQAVKTALRLGYRHIDCAFIYRNEAEIGQALSESITEGIVTRSDLWVTSKLWNDCHAPESVEGAIRQTLADLQLDYLDLYLIHWPVALKKGAILPETGADLLDLATVPIATTWRAMERLVTQGLCRHIGVSNFSVAKLTALLTTAHIRPEMNQIELHPYLQQPAMLTFCCQQGILLTAYSPLGSRDRPPGLKTANEPMLLDDPTIGAIATQHQATPAQVLIAWAMQRGTAVIPKSVHPERLAQNLGAIDVVLTTTEMAAIAQLDRHQRYVSGSFWTMPGSPYTLENLWDE